MALVARCHDCTRVIDPRLGGSLFEAVRPNNATRAKKVPPKYSYDRLPQNRGYVRLLNLRGSSFENPFIECDLVLKKFHQEHEEGHDAEQSYEALSWCWGTAKPSAYVNIRKDGKVFSKKIPPDLFAALKALRYPKEDRYLWIDAICINQRDPLEKNHQVEMMADIYGQAKEVCIWLGEGDRSSQMALQFIQEEILLLQNFDELCESEQASEKWSALLDLMQRDWFSRRWVVQELALARRAKVYCGSDSISWKKFAVAVELFVEVETATHRLSEVMKKDPKFYHVPGWFEYVSALGASLLVDATGKLFRDYKPYGPLADMEYDDKSDNESFLSLDSYQWSETDPDAASEADAVLPADETMLANKGQPLLSLEYLVSNLSIFNVTVPHDAVYALLAIAVDTIPSAGDEKERIVLDQTKEALERRMQKKRYIVNYAQPFSDVCKEFVQFCIDQSEPSRALDIICRPWAPEWKPKPPKKIPFGREYANDTPGLRVPMDIDISSEDPSEGLDRDHTTDDRKEKDRRRSQPKSPLNKIIEDQVPLPSWIPQLDRAAHAMLPQAGVRTLKMGRKNADTLVGLPSSGQNLQRNYNAAQTKGIDRKTFRFSKRAVMKHHSMYVQGFLLDTVAELQPASQGGAIPSGWAKAGGWRDVQFSDPPDEFWRTLVADRGRDGKNPPVYYSRACKESFVKGGLSSGSVNTTDLINNERCSVVAQFCRRVQAVIWNRCLIKTESLRLGLASQYIQLGDVICILYGCSVPVALRRKWKTREQVKQEVKEDIRLWKEDFVTTWRKLWESSKTKRRKRDWLRIKWALWDHLMQEKWQKDQAWHASWQSQQKTVELGELQKGDSSKDKARMANNMKGKMGQLPPVREELEIADKGLKETFIGSEESYQGSEERDKGPSVSCEERLRWKSYLSWKEEQKAAAKAKEANWYEPKPNWREFELYLRFGRRWKAYWMKVKQMEKLREQLQALEAQLRVPGGFSPHGAQFKDVPQPLPKFEVEETVNGVQGETHNTRHSTIDDFLSLYQVMPERSVDDPLLMGGKQALTHYIVSHWKGITSWKLSSRLPVVEEPQEALGLFSSHSRTETGRNLTGKTIVVDDPEIENTLANQFMAKFKLRPEDNLTEPKQVIDASDSEDVQRVKQNWCYYEVLGECYVHGMMDGEAMAHQNDKGIRAQVFELH